MKFSCVHERIPSSKNEIEEVFLYARWVQKNNLLKRDARMNAEVERLYRIAAEHGHHKSNINLQNGAMRGHFKLRGKEHLRLSEQLIDSGVATGFLFVGYFLQDGSAGLREDKEMALRYFRRAADEGNAQAQYYVGDKLAQIYIESELSSQMLRCAAEQGHRKAAMELGVYYKIKQQYRISLEFFQLGVSAGDSTSASFLSKGFIEQEPTNALHYLNQHEDQERAERYKKISRILSGYSYADPKVPEINDIVPLPPAKLPPWDGKLQWLEERLANVPPEKPSEALIQRLAKEKLLDPATGRPLTNHQK
ncbi:Sel1 repeat protein [compost metagenome]